MRPFSDGFRFGVATADHQCEAFDETFGPDVRDVWEERRGLTPRGKATDFWNRYREDVALAARLGCTTFRISLGWGRLEPKPGVYDDAAFEHYRELLLAIRSAGMTSIVTLHHYTWPLHVEQRGGMIHRDFPAWFTAYATETAKRLGALIDSYITFNEPNQLIYGYVKPWWMHWYAMPPGLPPGTASDVQMAHAQDLIHNLFVAHARARAAIRAERPNAPVGTNSFLLGVPGWLQWLADFNVTRIRSSRDFRRLSGRVAERGFAELGKVDVVIARFTATRERAERVQFSEAYLVAHQVAVAKSGTPNLARDWAGKIAVTRGTTAEARVGSFFPNATPLVVEELKDTIAAVRDGSADAGLGDDVQLKQFFGDPANGLRVVTGPLDDEPYAAALAPGNRTLLDAVDAGVRDFKKTQGDASAVLFGTRASLADLRGHVAAPREARRTDSIERVRRRGRLVVGVTPGVPGLCEYDPKAKRYSGLEIDLARAIARGIFDDPGKVEFRVVDMQDRISVLRSPLRFIDQPLRLLTFFTTMLTANWWHLGMLGRLPEFLCPKECVGALDFVGLDYYWGVPSIARIAKLLNAAAEKYGSAPVWPGGLSAMLRKHAKMFPGKPIVVVENGCVQSAGGTSRETYLREHLREVQRAVQDGIPVTAYLCWSITSNREWGLPFNGDSDFGIYHIDLDGDPALTRKPTPSSAVYGEIIAKRSAE
jgi:beta-glucosidase/6-phospho-beta-glucosidase/beta-galactosidase/ABC-type amino acid transport substrate-binding protein